MTVRSCLACKKPIKGRTDKKFCDNTCRNSYNNRLNSDATPLMRTINNILRRNRRILEELLIGRDKTAIVIDGQKLLEKGFHFDYFTERYTNDKFEEYCYCYDYGYRRLEGGKVMAVKDTRKKQVEKKSRQPLM
jgi:hypothetical protein